MERGQPVCGQVQLSCGDAPGEEVEHTTVPRKGKDVRSLSVTSHPSLVGGCSWGH